MHDVTLKVISEFPINASLRRHFIKKFEWLTVHNGETFAEEYFKSLRLAVMRYLSIREFNPSQQESVALQYGVSTGVWTKRLMFLSQSKPMLYLEFLKFPSGVLKTREDKDSFFETVKNDIQGISTLGTVPVYVDSVTESAITRAIAMTRDSLDPEFETFGSHDIKLMRQHSQELVRRYLKRKAVSFMQTIPSDYRDAIQRQGRWESKSYERDLKRWLRRPIPRTTDVVGRINLVPKGDTSWRAVASPNKFYQDLTKPYYDWLRVHVESMVTDATYDQGKFDVIIQNWVDSTKFKPCSVDLKQATNNLPISWLQPALELMNFRPFNPQYGMQSLIADSSEQELAERELLSSMVASNNIQKGYWELANSSKDLVRFVKGQPLGTLPSFQLLAIQNHLLAEISVQASIQVNMTYRKDTTDLRNEQQYAILGDDIVFKNEQVAKVYRSLVRDLDVPVSEHKSFSDNLVEFAGKMFIKNQGGPAFIADFPTLKWSTQFQFVAMTGIKTPIIPPNQGKVRQLSKKLGRDVSVAEVIKASKLVQDQYRFLNTRTNEISLKKSRVSTVVKSIVEQQYNRAKVSSRDIISRPNIIGTSIGGVDQILKVGSYWTNVSQNRYRITGLKEREDNLSSQAWAIQKFGLSSSDFLIESALAFLG